MPERSRSARWRSLAFLAQAAAILFLVLGVLLGVGGERAYRQHSAQTTEVQARLLAASVGSALEFDDTSIVRENVHALAAHPGIASAAVYDSAGRPIATFARADVRPPAHTSAVATHGAPGTALVPILSDGVRIGSVFVSSAAQPLVERLARYGSMFLLVGMGALVAGLAMATNIALQRSNADLATSNARLRAEMAERETAEEQLRQAQKMQAVGQLTGGVAHDFNNLLTPIIGGLSLLALSVSDPRLRRTIDNALEAAERGKKLASQLLAFSRTHRLNVVPVRINAVIASMQDLLAHSIGASVHVQLDLAPAVEAALCDANQVENALLNLAINARDAMPNGGTLTISTRRIEIAGKGELPPGSYVEIAINDTGLGMSPEVLARATEPFFTTKPVGQGTGLGLSQVYGIAQQFGGTLRITSVVGQGTTVRLILPAAAADAIEAAPHATNDAARPANSAGARILVVDDDPEVRSFLEDTLEMMGYRVTSAAGGEEGLRLLATCDPDLLLVDYAMPDLNGMEVARTVKRFRPSLPIICATGHANAAEIENVLGSDGTVVHKPFRTGDLVAAIEHQFRQARRT